MIKEIPKTDFESPATRSSAESGEHSIVLPTQAARVARPLRDVSRDTVPDLGPEADGELGERDTDVDPLRFGQRRTVENTETRMFAPEILLSEGYGPTPIAAAKSPERPEIDIVEGGIPDEIPPATGYGEGRSGGSGGGKRPLGERAKSARADFEAAVRENPVRAVGLAAGAGFAAGAALFATPVVRVLVGGIASVALQSDGAKRIYGHIGTSIVERLEGIFTGADRAKG